METTKTGKNIPKNWPREKFTVVDAGGLSCLRVAFYKSGCACPSDCASGRKGSKSKLTSLSPSGNN